MWTDLKGWDSPGEENAERVRSFQSDEYAFGKIILPYRYYISKEEGSLPLVVFLHGADAVGNDNEKQLSLHDVGTVFADAAWQERHPCHILAPQYEPRFHWAHPAMTNGLHSLVEDMIKHHSVDRKRLYIYGYSAGAIGLFSFLKQYPEYFAAAIPICGSTTCIDVENLVKTPIWMFHAADDTIVSPGSIHMHFGKQEHLGSHVLAQRLKQIGGGEVRYTEYPEGEMMHRYGLHPHCSWVLMGRDEAAKEWLFSKSR